MNPEDLPASPDELPSAADQHAGAHSPAKASLHRTMEMDRVKVGRQDLHPRHAPTERRLRPPPGALEALEAQRQAAREREQDKLDAKKRARSRLYKRLAWMIPSALLLVGLGVAIALFVLRRFFPA